MFNKKRLFVQAALILTSFFGVSEANAQNPPWDPACPYTLASLQGSYAIIVHYSPDVALSLQAETLDGKGRVTRAGIVNQPLAGSTSGERTVGTVSSTGTYTVNCNGTGTFTAILTRPDGTIAPAGISDFIITQAIQSPGQPPIATTIADAQRAPSLVVPGNILLTRVHTRLPDIVCEHPHLFVRPQQGRGRQDGQGC
jgi:hypothetical protein